MHLINQKALGILIIVLLGLLVVIKRVATGSILEKPQGGILLWLVNIFNLLFLLVINPLAAILLIMKNMEAVDPSILVINSGLILLLVEIVGLIIYLSGFFLMTWALMSLGRNYQLGGADPRSSDKMIINGPYKFIRHPMYTAALCIALGLAFLIQSTACLAAFCMYLVLLFLTIPDEEDSLIRAYGEPYKQYQQKVGKFVPFL